MFLLAGLESVCLFLCLHNFSSVTSLVLKQELEQQQDLPAEERLLLWFGCAGKAVSARLRLALYRLHPSQSPDASITQVQSQCFSTTVTWEIILFH